jgi:ketosteroid isomerase-like protein
LLPYWSGQSPFWALNKSVAFASGESDKTAIFALNQDIAESYNRKDLDRVLSYYSKDSDAVFYEDNQLETKGWKALREYFRKALASSNNLQQELSEMAVVVNEDVAAAHYIILGSWSEKG